MNSAAGYLVIARGKADVPLEIRREDERPSGCTFEQGVREGSSF